MAKDDPKSGTTGSGSTPRSTGGKPSRRVPPTLDLSAKDVTPPPAKPAEAATSADKATAHQPATVAPGSIAPVSDGAATAGTPVATPVESSSDTPAAAPAAADIPVIDADAVPAQDGAERPPPAEPVKPSQTAGSAAVPAAGAKPVRQLGLIGGLAAALLSGVIGAAIAVAVVGSFTSAEDDADAITQLEARALDLRQRVETLEASGGAPDATPGATAPAELAARLDALESGIDTLGRRVDSAPAAAPSDGASAEAVSQLGSRVGALEERISSAQAPAAAQDVATLTTRLDGVESKLSALPTPPPAASPDDLAAANTRIAALEKQLAVVATAQTGSGQGAAQLVALASLRDAIAASKPFAAELKASRALLGTEGAPLAALEPAAAQGFATGPALAAELRRAIAPAPVAPITAGAPTTDEGVLDRLMRGAQGLVTVRRADTPAVAPGFAEAEAALARGDYAGARAALAGLPEAERARVQTVLQSLEARQAALDAIAGLNQNVLASLAGGSQ